MSPVESIQCPKCGSPLEVTSSTTSAQCSFCGSSLRVTRGASGHPLASVLEDIKTGTDILALDVLRRQVEGRLADLRQSLAALHAEQATASRISLTAGGFVAPIAILASVTAAFAVLASDASTGLLIGTVAGILYFIFATTKTNRETQELHVLDEQIANEEARLCDLIARMDELGKQL